MDSKFINSFVVLNKDFNLLTDPKSSALVIAEMASRYTKEYNNISFDIIVLEDEAEYIVFAKEPFTKEEAKEWLLNKPYYKEHYSEPILKECDKDFPIIVSLPESIYKHKLLSSLIDIGCTPVLIQSCFEIYQKYDEMCRNGNEPKAIILHEQSGVFDEVLRFSTSHPNTKIIGLVAKLDDTLPVIRFIKSGASLVLKADLLEKNYINRVFSCIFPNIFVD